LDPEDCRVLLQIRQSKAGYHKNISYRPSDDRLRGVDREGADVRVIQRIMRTYSEKASTFVSSLLSPYADMLRIEMASFRPIEERGRKMSPKNRNDLLHVDAFPTRPTNGNRILRVFTNISPTQARGWMTTDTFDVLAGRFAMHAGLSTLSRRAQSNSSKAWRAVRRGLRHMGLPLKDRSPYDRFMLTFHDYLKSNDEFQKNCTKRYREFPPGSTWLVFTDMVPHAVLFGQFALEQTFIIDRRSLVRPDKAPVNILESLARVPLTNATSRGLAT